MLVKIYTAWVTCPFELASGAARFAIGAKNARKMCDMESIRKTRSTGLLPAGACFVGMCFDDSEAFSECQLRRIPKRYFAHICSFERANAEPREVATGCCGQVHQM